MDKIPESAAAADSGQTNQSKEVARTERVAMGVMVSSMGVMVSSMGVMGQGS